ncbi:MAG: ligase-associated DNA damage response DEXH box helicase [Phycisphaerales bacterium]|nr:MAG: ligase-associated DNA damage response DEXH box helicase [Phycisphaerales bacterium]
MSPRTRATLKPDLPEAPHPALAHDNGLGVVRAWFASRGWTPWAFQEDAWRAHTEGRSGLIHVPTGAGKTYAAFGGPLAALIDESRTAGDAWTGRGVRVLYITPLRAVSRDIDKALRLPIEDMGLGISVESRTGDTTSSVRARQRSSLPNVLVTTPESLSLLLSKPECRQLFRTLRTVLIDEWHELLSTKRGTQTELTLARLRRFASGVRTWAMTATISNVGAAARAAAGTTSPEEPVLVRADMHRPVHVDTVIPKRADAFPWAGHMGLSLLPEVLERLDPAHSTLIFMNTRNQAERWFSAISAARPGWASVLALHHGSIDRDERERVEAGLKDGSIRMVVATSSLDLGVDFSPVERVFQIGSPKGIARLIQRAGRSAHRPGEACGITCVPTHGMELIEVAAVRRSLDSGVLEPRGALDQPLDVLAQHMVTCALGGGFEPGDLHDEVRATVAYAGLSREAFDWTLKLVEEGGGTLRAYPAFCKIVRGEGGRYTMPSRRLAQLHRLNVGTITGDSTVAIRYQSGRSLGSIEEAFVQRLRVGQKFVFAGKLLAFVRMHELTAYVRPATGRTTYTPHWGGTRLPISESMSESVRTTLEEAGRGDRSLPELEAAGPIVEAQSRLSRVPGADELLAETCTTREGRHLFLYPFEGRLVHGGLAALLALRIARIRSATFTISFNDYGLELLTPDEAFDFEPMLTPALFSRERLLEDTIESVNLGELAKGQFREVARVSGLVFQSFPGGYKSGRQLHASSGLIYDVLRDFDPGHLLLKQAEREVMERQFEQKRLSRTLARLEKATLVRTEPKRPTPLGFPLVIERIGGQLSTESLLERVERMKKQWAGDMKVKRR